MIVIYEIVVGTNKWLSEPIATSSYTTETELPTITVCPRRYAARLANKYGLEYQDYRDGKFVPDNFESLGKSLDEIFEESINDAYYLLDVTGTRFQMILENIVFILVERDDCKVIQENGTYRRIYDGHENVTEDGEPCLNWSEVEDAADLIGVDGVGDHNYCRGPGGSGKIYCYISQTKTDHCKVRTCGES